MDECFGVKERGVDGEGEEEEEEEGWEDYEGVGEVEEEFVGLGHVC